MESPGMSPTSRPSKKPQPLNPFRNGDAWRQFQSLEKSLHEFIEYVPLLYRNRNVSSPKLATILMSASIQTEAVFKAIINSDYVEHDSMVKRKALKEARAAIRTNRGNIRLYRVVLEPLFSLSKRRVIIWKRPEIYRRAYPYLKFRLGKSPRWWDIYNDVKHSFYENASKATLRWTFSALAALFVIHVMHLEHRETLVKLNVIRSVKKEDKSSSLSDTDLTRLISSAPRDLSMISGFDVWAETEFFELQLGKTLDRSKG